MERQRRGRGPLAAAALLAALALGGCQTEETLSSPKAPKAEARPRDIPQIPSTFAISQVGGRAAKGRSLRVYQTATISTRGGAVSSLKSWMSKVTLDVPAFIVRHPAHGPIVFDTGCHPDMESKPKEVMGRFNYFLVPFEQKPGQNLVAQMKRDGMDPEQVRWVVVSHLHLDHAGMIESFPNATIIVDKREWAYWKDLPEKDRRKSDPDPALLEPRLSKLRLVDLSSAPAFGPFDHGLDLLGDGSLVLLDLSGHTAGSLGAWLNLEEGPALLTGDASWILDNHEDLALPIKGHIHDLKSYWRRLYQIRDAQEAARQLVVLPGHDLAPLKIRPRADVSLAPFPR